MIDTTIPVLVVGAGSIGERYIRNLWAMGFRHISVLRQRNLPFRDIGNAEVKTLHSWNEVDEINPKAAFICTPTAMHLENALQSVDRGIHVLIEKPISHTVTEINELINKATDRKVYVHIGYMMRYYPLLIKAKEILKSDRYGKLLHMSSSWCEYLPDWHPWEDYRQSYAAKKELGGGVALTLSHDLDVCNWMVEQIPVSWSKEFNYRSDLELNVEAGADFLLRYQDGVTANVHLNYFQKKKERWYKYILEEAVIEIDFLKHELCIDNNDLIESIALDTFDRNELFIDELKDFFSSFENTEKSATNIREAAKLIEICNS